MDSEVKRTLTEFQDYVWDDESGPYENVDSTCQKEFSFYQECFTLTWRNRRWRKVPTNTLATGDIIKLLPGEFAPAMIKQLGVYRSIDPDEEPPQSDQEERSDPHN